MGWRDWPYWLKGGITLAVLAILLFVLALLFGLAGYGSIAESIGYPLILSYIFIGVLLFSIDKTDLFFNKGYNLFESEATILGYIVIYGLSILFYFIIG